MSERRYSRAPAPQISRNDNANGPTRIEGYAAVFYREGEPATEYWLWDDIVERILPSAFDRALAEQQDVRALFNHDPNQVLGRTAANTLALRVDETGLSYTIVPPDTNYGRDCLTNLARGDVTGSSFSFEPLEIAWREIELPDRGKVIVRELLSVRLYDVGPVTFPAYEGTSAGVRSARPADAQAVRAAWETERTARQQRAGLPARIAAAQARARVCELRE